MLSFYDLQPVRFTCKFEDDEKDEQVEKTKDEHKVCSGHKVVDWAALRPIAPGEDASNWILTRIRQAVDVADVFNQITIYKDRLQPSHLAAALHRIARYFRQRNSNIGSMRDAPRWLALLREVEKKIEVFDPQDITDTTWALAVIAHRDRRLVRAICSKVARRCWEFSPQNIAITAWGLATLNFRDDVVFKRFSIETQIKLAEFEAQGISNMAWAYATLRFKDDILFSILAAEAPAKIDAFSPQHLSNMAWAYATMGRRSDKLFNTLARHAVDLLKDPRTASFLAMDLGLLIWAYAHLQYHDSEFCEAIVRAALPTLNHFRPQSLANLLWGMDHLGYFEPSAFAELLAFCNSRPASYWDRCAGEEMTKIANSFRSGADDSLARRNVEELFLSRFVRPLANYMIHTPRGADYGDGLRQLQIFHVGYHFSRDLLEMLDIRVASLDEPEFVVAIHELLEYYRQPPVGAVEDGGNCRGWMPGLFEILEVKTRAYPSSHWLALHISVDLEVNGKRVAFRRCVPAKASRDGGLSYIRGEKFEPEAMPELGPLQTAGLAGYERRHHAEICSLNQVIDALEGAPAESVRGVVRMFAPHYACASCAGAMRQFVAMYPGIEFRVAYEDWRKWIRRLWKIYDPSDHGHRHLSVSAAQLVDWSAEASSKAAVAKVDAMEESARRANLGGNPNFDPNFGTDNGGHTEWAAGDQVEVTETATNGWKVLPCRPKPPPPPPPPPPAKSEVQPTHRSPSQDEVKSANGHAKKNSGPQSFY